MYFEQYSYLASVYDSLNLGCDYEAYADFIKNQIEKNQHTDTALVLDLACGTGRMTFALRERGYDMTGIDLSEEMLSVAIEESQKKNIGDILWLCQDMTDFELYGTVDACVCCLDSLNYLLKAKDIKACFDLVHNYLIPDGVFIFDMNTPYRFESVYGDNDIILESDDTLLAWQNDYNKKSGICNFLLSIFSKNRGGTYSRVDELQRERCYKRSTVEKMLKDSGFEIIAVYGNTDAKKVEPTDEKWYFITRCIKK